MLILTLVLAAWFAIAVATVAVCMSAAQGDAADAAVGLVAVVEEPELVAA